MELRRLSKSDAQECFSTRLRGLERDPTAFAVTFGEEEKRGIGFFENILSTPGDGNVVFGAFVDGSLRGIIGILQSDRSKMRHKASIWGMYVDREYRGQGLGSALLDLAIRHAKERMAVSAVYLTVESSNRNAIALYESRSFRRWGTEPRALRFQDRFYDDDHMMLEL